MYNPSPILTNSSKILTILKAMNYNKIAIFATKKCDCQAISPTLCNSILYLCTFWRCHSAITQYQQFADNENNCG